LSVTSHSGSANTLVGDGSACFVADTSGRILPAIVTVGGGEPTNLPDWAARKATSETVGRVLARIIS
jgi:hypothetical protein